MRPFILPTTALLLMLPSVAVANLLPKGEKFTVTKVEVSCDGGIQFGVKSQEASFSTNVDLKLDDFRLRCDRLDISYLEAGGNTQVKTLEATGHVVCEQASRSLKAWSDRLRYDRDSNQLVFSSQNRTKVVQGENHLEAAVILIDLKTGEAIAKGGGSLEINLDEVK